MLKLLGIGLLVAVFCLLLGELGSRSRPAVSVLGSVIILLGVMPEISGVISEVLSISDKVGASEIATLAAKLVGIGYIFGLVAEICEGLSERGVANAVLLAGRVEIFVLVFPCFKELLQLGLELLS